MSTPRPADAGPAPQASNQAAEPHGVVSAAPGRSIFASRGLAEHIVRGVIGLVALQQAVALSATQPLSSLVLAGTALLAFRGCPVCWTIGLVETAYRQLKRLAHR